MIKPLIISSTLILSLYAQNFEEFLQHAIENSPYLKASSKETDQVKTRGDVLLRYENPNIELEASSFNPESGKNNSGYRVSLIQPIRLWDVADGKKQYAKAMVERARAEYALSRADFIREISLQYLHFAHSHKLIGLGKQELELAQKIYTISQARFNEGTISRGKLLQAKIDYEMALSHDQSILIERDRSYYLLLQSAGIKDEIPLHAGHIFTPVKTRERHINPQQRVLKARSGVATAQAKVDEKQVEWIELFGEYEKEPEQDLIRFGVHIPLALFNTGSQERKISALESEQTRLLETASVTQTSIEQRRLHKESHHLGKYRKHSEAILKTELELLGMYEEGYKIANVNLLELQDIKNKVIALKIRLIEIESKLQANIIHQNYLQGHYNE